MPSSPRWPAAAAVLLTATVAVGCTDSVTEPSAGEVDVAAEEAVAPAATPTSEAQTVTGDHGAALVPGAALVATSSTLRYASVTGDRGANLISLDGVEITAVAVRPGSTPGDLVAVVSGYEESGLGSLWWVTDHGGTVTWNQFEEVGSLGDMIAVWAPDGSAVSWARDPYEDTPGSLHTATWAPDTGTFDEPVYDPDHRVDSRQVLFDWRESPDGDSRYARDVVDGGVAIHRSGADGEVDVIAQPAETVIAAVEDRIAATDRRTHEASVATPARTFVLDRPMTAPDTSTTLLLRGMDADGEIKIPLPATEGRGIDHRLAAGLDAVATITRVPGLDVASRMFALVESPQQGTPLLVERPWPFGDDVVDVAFLWPPAP